MALDISFILRANTASFTKGLASANNSIESLRKNVRHGDIGNGIKQMLSAGAIVAAFRSVINYAQETRNAFEAIGKAIPSTTASVAQLADAMDMLKKTFLTAGSKGLGFFTGIGEGIGNAINRVRGFFGAKIFDPVRGGKMERDADLAEAARDEAYRQRQQRNSRENQRKLQDQIRDASEARAEATATREQKVNTLLQQQLKLREDLSSMLSNPDIVKNDQAAILAKRLEIEKKGAQIDSAARSSDELQVKLLESQTDAFLPSIEDLALFQGGTNTGNAGQNAKGAAAAKAREYFNLQMQSRAAYQNGDLAGALSLSQKADQARFGLLGSAKSDEVNKGKELLDTTNKSLTELEQINKAINGIFVVPGK